MKSEPLLGQNKWLGGVSSLCGKYIYGIPGTAPQVLRITIETGKVDLIGPVCKGQYKWLRGVACPNTGKLYCLPSNAPDLLCIDPVTQEVTRFGGPFEGDWLFHGGNDDEKGNIWAIPANATQVLHINTQTHETRMVGPHFPGRQKWYGGIKANNCIYGIPQNANRVLKNNPATEECTLIGPDLGEGGWKFHGGMAVNNVVYGIPCNCDSVLKIDALTDTVTLIGKDLKSGRHRKNKNGENDDKYKYLGCGVARDGNVYFFPCDAEQVLCADTETDEVYTVGPLMLSGMNKFQNGFNLQDGVLYAIPQRETGCLQIKTPLRQDKKSRDDVEISILPCAGDEEFLKMKDKFEGAVEGSDGCVYLIPMRAKHIEKVIPGPTV